MNNKKIILTLLGLATIALVFANQIKQAFKMLKPKKSTSKIGEIGNYTIPSDSPDAGFGSTQITQPIYNPTNPPEYEPMPHTEIPDEAPAELVKFAQIQNAAERGFVVLDNIAREELIKQNIDTLTAY